MCILLRWTKGNGNMIYFWWQALGFTSKVCDLIRVPEFAGTAVRSPSADGAPNPSFGGAEGRSRGLAAWKPTQSKASRGWEAGEAAAGLLASKALFLGSFLDAPKCC